MPDVSYQKLIDFVLPSLPDNWTKLIVYVSFMQETCDLKYYVRDKSNRYLDCIQLSTDYSVLLNILSKIHHEIAEMRNQLPENDRWDFMTLCVEDNGSFQTYYDYLDDSESIDMYNDKWRKRYLN